MVMSQNTHLHPSASIKKPPTIGPIIGPNSGPRDHKLIANPLFSTGIKSAIVPLPHVTVATPASPARNLNAIKVPMFCETAQPIVKSRKSTLQVW